VELCRSSSDAELLSDASDGEQRAGHIGIAFLRKSRPSSTRLLREGLHKLTRLTDRGINDNS
jgi:hypothetical protein